MHRVNLTDPPVTYDDTDPDEYRAGMFRFGKQLGAEQTGASVYVLAPGVALCPYHYEYAEEEWLLVLAGRPSVRTSAGVDVLEINDMVFFPRGPEGAHQVRNDSDEPARVLLWSTVVHPAATAYPDSDKIAIHTGIEGEDVMVRRSSAVEYYDGERGGTAPSA
jgi:uncharacterized cupin superfamily protein